MNRASLIEWASSWVPDVPAGQRARFVEALSAELKDWREPERKPVFCKRRLRGRRPDVEALKKLGAAFAGLVPLLFVTVFLAVHRNSELWGLADPMMVLTTFAVIERFHAVLDAWKVVMGKAPTDTVGRLAEARSAEPEMVAVPPQSPEKLTT